MWQPITCEILVSVLPAHMARQEGCSYGDLVNLIQHVSVAAAISQPECAGNAWAQCKRPEDIAEFIQLAAICCFEAQSHVMKAQRYSLQCPGANLTNWRRTPQGSPHGDQSPARPLHRGPRDSWRTQPYLAQGGHMCWQRPPCHVVVLHMEGLSHLPTCITISC